MIVYGIPNCDTVKKARLWLSSHGQEHQFHDFKKLGVPPAPLARWIEALGWEKIVNRQGTTWRKLDAAAQASVQDAASASALVQAQPSLIKRPVVEWPDGSVSVGFQAEAWQARLGEKA
jgi:Spx/MgsR family transcriptional regulator